MSEPKPTEDALSAAWKLPTGMPVPEASRSINQAEQEHLYKQEYDQAARLDVLRKCNVTSMSRVSCLLLVKKDFIDLA